MSRISPRVTRRLASGLKHAHRSNDFIPTRDCAQRKLARRTRLPAQYSHSSQHIRRRLESWPLLADDEMVNLAKFITESCLHFHGSVTIGSLSGSLSRDENHDLGRLKETLDKLQITLKERGVDRWEEDGGLALSMDTPGNPGAARERKRYRPRRSWKRERK